MIILQLNDMRSSNIEILTPVLRAETKEELKAFIESEKVPSYSDGRWRKCFRQGGPLEWYNEPYDHFEHDHFVDVGTLELAIEQTRKNWNDMVESVPTIPIDVVNADFGEAEVRVCALIAEGKLELPTDKHSTKEQQC